nr:hypothetical protein [uncultured Actinoplanes sp.]
MQREIGSEFHWDPTALSDRDSPMPARHKLFATGCGALTALLRRLAPRGRLHIPSYFCMGVAEALSETVPIAWYRHLPGGAGPRWESLRARPGDLVLAQNLFGREDGRDWTAWIRAHPRVTVIEDHSHDPFGPWARASIAPYAVASLRKTLPVPDGGLLWSPQDLPMPAPDGPDNPGSDLKLAAMLLKSAWLDGVPVPKDKFRMLQQRGENVLLGSTAPIGIVTRVILPFLDIDRLRLAATANVRALREALPATPDWQVLAGGSGDGAPFRLQLLCRDGRTRDALLAHLAAHGIYAPVHWRQDRTGVWSGDEDAADLASRMLTVPVDHRCTPADLRRLTEVLGSPIRREPARQ